MTKKVNFSTRSQLIRGSLRYLIRNNSTGKHAQMICDEAEVALMMQILDANTHTWFKLERIRRHERSLPIGQHNSKTCQQGAVLHGCYEHVLFGHLRGCNTNAKHR